MTLKDALSAKMISPEDRQLFLQRIDEQINARDQARNVSSEINQLKTEKSDLQIKLSKAEKGKEELTKRLSGLKDVRSTTTLTA
jgi:predicted  nucleic acid-binding Zn-ribbon protein